MALATKTHTFQPGAVVRSAQVNRNYDDVLSFLNTHVMQRDGSKAFATFPSVTDPNWVPTAAGQLVHREYVDSRKRIVLAVDTPTVEQPIAQNANYTILSSNAATVASRWYWVTWGCTAQIPSFFRPAIRFEVLAAGTVRATHTMKSLLWPFSVNLGFMVQAATTNTTFAVRCNNCSQQDFFQGGEDYTLVTNPSGAGTMPGLRVFEMGGA